MINEKIIIININIIIINIIVPGGEGHPNSTRVDRTEEKKTKKWSPGSFK